MKVLAVNGSPKTTGSASLSLLESWLSRLGPGTDLTRIQAMADRKAGGPSLDLLAADLLVIAFPLYVDGLPAPLLEWLIAYAAAVADRRRKEPGWKPATKVYALANCGFHEGRQNALALAIVQNFAAEAGLAFGGGLGVGTGGMVLGLSRVPDHAGIKRPVAGGVAWLADLAAAGSAPGEVRFVQHGFPRFAYILAAHAGWRRLARSHGLTGRRLRDRPLA